MVTAAALQSIPFFANFTPAELDGIATAMVERAYRPGEVIFLERQPSTGLFFVASGRVRVFRTAANGKEQTLCVMSPRTCFGGCPLFNGNLSPVTAQALDAVSLYVLLRDDVLARVKDNPLLGQVVLKVFGERLNHLTAIVDGLTFKCAVRRLADTLLACADENGRPTERGIEIDLGLSQDKLASLLGCTREVVTRSLLRLERLGAIDARGRQVFVIDRNKLVDLNGKV